MLPPAIEDHLVTVKDDLHRLVEELPAQEIAAARRYLEYLRNIGSDPVMAAQMPAANNEPTSAADDATAALLVSGELAGLERLRKAVFEPTRAQIIRALGAGPLSVQDLADLLDRRQPATSQHLRVLRDVGVVEVERRGRQSYYRLSVRPMAAAAAELLAALSTTT
jgi:DNA-binding transcriptional ArsR family regulator